MNPDLKVFERKYRATKFMRAEALFESIDSESFFKVLRYPSTQPCGEIAQVYRNRADNVSAEGPFPDQEMFAEFSEIAETLSESPDEPCRLWIFRGREKCFSIFEMEESNRIGGCLMRGGASESEIDSEESTPRQTG